LRRRARRRRGIALDASTAQAFATRRPTVALGLEHRDDVMRLAVAEELAELLLVIGDADAARRAR
jgi:hypothetical protein